MLQGFLKSSYDKVLEELVKFCKHLFKEFSLVKKLLKSLQISINKYGH